MRGATSRRPSLACAAPLIASATAVGTAAVARRRVVGRCEERVFRAVNDASDRAHVPVWAVMQSGSLAAVAVTSAALVRQGRRAPALVAATFGGGVWVGAKAVKHLVGRGRPDAYLDDVTVRGSHQHGCGYPSGHAAVVTTLGMVVASQRDRSTAVAAAAVAAATGAARMYVGAHLPLDVVGGYAIGGLAGVAARRVLGRS